MARHNRDGEGEDQRGYEYSVSYQPDWLSRVKVTRQLESGRQSTMTLFKNPAERKKSQPGRKIRTRIRCSEQDLDFKLALFDPRHRITRIRIAYTVPAEDQPGGEEEVEFTLENDLPPPEEE